MIGFQLMLRFMSGLAIAAIAVGASADDVGQRKNRYTPIPEVKNLDEGISWPAGQALPIFALPAATLDALEVQALSADEQITFSSLQGQVNKKQPRILLLDARADEGRDTWVNTATVGIKVGRRFSRETKYDLLARYVGEVAGIVLYDARGSAHYRNLAGTVAGLHKALPATAEVKQRIEERGITLKVVADLTELKFSSPVEIYRHLHETYWTKCEKRLIVSARPDSRGGDLHHTRDIAAACGAAVVWLDCRQPAEKEVMRKFYGDMKAGSGVVLGWHATERSGVTTASEFGIGTLPADHYMSGSVFSASDHRIQIPAVPKSPPLENKAYVAIFISDGDNIQYSQRALRRIGDRSAASRGKVALNWTIAPGLVDIGPGILNYYYSTATPLDCFVSGPSGMGYLMPFNTLNEPGAPVGLCLADAARMDGYARLTETYLQRAGLRVVTIWDEATASQRTSYAKQCRNLYGATVHNFKDVPTVEASVADRRVRFDKLVIPYVGTYRHISESLQNEIRRWDGKTPLFFSYQVAIWNEMKPDRIVELAREMDAKFPGRLAFVRADHYFQLYNEAHELPYNLVLSPRTSVKAGDMTDNPNRATDGTPATIWSSSKKEGRWLEFDFGGEHMISRYVIRHAGAGANRRDFNTRDFAVQASGDGKNWTTIDAVRGNREDVTDVDVEPVRARHLKMVIEHPGDDSAARIGDVEIFGVTKR